MTMLLTALPSLADPLLPKFLSAVTPDQIVPGADSFGPLSDKAPVAPVLKGDNTVGWAYLTSDWVSTTGYSGKPIHIIVGISAEAVITGVRLVKHSEPIVLVGIPEARIKEVIREIRRARPEDRRQDPYRRRHRHRLGRHRDHHDHRRFDPARPASRWRRRWASAASPTPR